MQYHLRKNNVNSGVHGGINISAIDSLTSWRAGQTAMRMNHRTDVPVGLLRQGELADEAQANTGRMMHQGIGADISLFGNGNQISEGLSACALNNDGQSIGGTMSDWYMVNLSASGNTDDSIREIPKIGYNPTPWWSKGDLGTGELVVMPEFFQTVDDVVRHYGGWTGIENEIPEEMRGSFSAAYTFLSTWGSEYAQFLLSKVPMPPNVRLVIEVACFMMLVCEIANEVQKKRKNMIDSLTKDGTPTWIAEAEADKKVHGWLLEEIGKVIVSTVVGNVLDRLPWETYSKKYSNDYIKEAVIEAINALWDAFVEAVESGIWVRGIV